MRSILGIGALVASMAGLASTPSAELKSSRQRGGEFIGEYRPSRRKGSRYSPHQGDQEKARRVRQMAKAAAKSA